MTAPKEGERTGDTVHKNRPWQPWAKEWVQNLYPRQDIATKGASGKSDSKHKALKVLISSFEAEMVQDPKGDDAAGSDDEEDENLFPDRASSK